MADTRSREKSKALYREAVELMPGGVNSPVRAFGSVGGEPVFMSRGEGPYLWDADGHRYIDYIGSWGPMILGHTHPLVVQAVEAALKNGFSFGTPTEGESRLARLVREFVPSIEMVRFVSSGTEACMSALRLARGFTGRDKIIKFDGCYHGHADMLLVKAGSGVATLGIPGSPGVPEGTTAHTLTAPYNDLSAVEALFQANPGQIAAVIIEPFVGNSGFIRPAPGFLEGLRKLTERDGALLIFDEVMTGFRVARGGAQELVGIKPDLTTLGKVIGGGMPIGAYGGRRDIMAQVAPSGPVYQAGTLSGNPLAVACGLKTLEILKERCDYQELAIKTRHLMQGFKAAADKADIPLTVDQEGGMFGFCFTDRPVVNADDVTRSDRQRFNKFFHGMLDRGVYLAPSAYEAGFVSFAHADDVIDLTIRTAAEVMAGL